MSEQEALEVPKLDPRYVPATENSKLRVEFSGNTARIADVQFYAIDSFQLIAIGEYLKYRGMAMIAMNEAQVAQEMQRRAEAEKIAVAGRIPDPSELPDHLRPPG